MIFIPVSTYQPSKSWPFTYQMFIYLVQITVVDCDTQPSNDVNYFKVYYIAVIMQKGQYKVLLIKYNLNTMVEIDMCLQKVLHQNILVHLPNSDINSTTPSRQRHVLFHSFLSDDSKQDADTTTTHINHLISLLKDKKVLTTSLSTVC